MKVIENCWDDIDTYNCQYGAHVFANSTAKIYVNHWLSVSQEMGGDFYRKNNEGFVGHCILVFEGVKDFNFSVKLCGKDAGGNIFIQDSMAFNYVGNASNELKKYEFEGSLHGFFSSVSVSIEAQKFSLHILEKDEPARDS